MRTDETVIIEQNKKVNEKYYKLTFQSARLAQGVQPGQFMHVKITPVADPFLRRPFSYFRADGKRVEMLYEVLGRGTAILSHHTPGTELKIMGPLGKPFTQKVKGRKRVLVAGGVGVPPLVFLAEKTAADYLLIGTKSKAEVLPKRELVQVKAKILHTTNDGSYGTKGFVTVLLEQLIQKEGAENLFIQTCGPTVMMNAVMALAKRYGVPGEASMEENMACGVGTCLGCMVQTDKGWVTCCTEGPVFNFEKLVCGHGSH
ncbi:MAG: dihydroorotate dehydrogenase electron transfer subunit [Candidatus Omnitrophica bacterium]|nr:dihydroorotate dehydrogenase electron transfer subunit [Candidatus Omnitrophota bacterium]